MFLKLGSRETVKRFSGSLWFVYCFTSRMTGPKARRARNWRIVGGLSREQVIEQAHNGATRLYRITAISGLIGHTHASHAPPRRRPSS